MSGYTCPECGKHFHLGTFYVNGTRICCSSCREATPPMRPEYEKSFKQRVIAALNNPYGIDLACSCEDCCCNDAITYKLNPCPWCGSTKLKFRYDIMRDSTSVQCLNCHNVVSSIAAITTWNALLQHTRDNNE